MKKRLFALLLAMCLLLGGCAGETANNNGIVVTTSLEGKQTLVGDIECEFPLVTTPTSINVLACSYGGIDQSGVYVWQKYREMTGVDVNWTSVSSSERAEALNEALSSGRALDLVLRCKVSANRLTSYGESGLILDLAENDLLKNNAPNCWAYLQSHPEALASVTNPDGAIYSLPQVNSGAELRVSRKLFVNKQWLARVGMELPSTTEELYELLLAFKTQDANGNGDPFDEIPLCSQDWSSIYEALAGAFGLMNRGVNNTSVDFDEAAGKARFIYAAPEYREFLSYMNRLYSEGLLDNYIFSMTTNQWSANATADLIGVFINTNLATLPADCADNWVALEQALEGPSGCRIWSAVRGDFHSTGAAVLPATCKNPELVLRWLDYFWTDEGTLFYHMGIEGETFVVDENGGYDYTPEIYAQMTGAGVSFDDVISKYSPYPGGSNPTVEIAPYFMGGEMAQIPAAAARAMFPYASSEFWPSFTFTAEENERLAPIRTDMEKYVNTMRIEFITGETSLSEWETYLAQLEKLKMNDFLSIYQTALDRYTKSKSDK